MTEDRFISSLNSQSTTLTLLNSAYLPPLTETGQSIFDAVFHGISILCLILAQVYQAVLKVDPKGRIVVVKVLSVNID